MTMLDSFLERFDADTASAITDAAIEHSNDVHDQRGSDPFRWALLICLGYECMEKERMRQYHKITPAWSDLHDWMTEEPQRQAFAEHDGDVDYLALFVGVYTPYVVAT